MERGFRSEVTAAQVLAPVLLGHAATLRRAESDVRLDHSAGVHDFRVASRTLRSLVTAAYSLFESTHDLPAGLQEAGRAAGEARDTDVLRLRLVGALGEQPAGSAALLLRERLERELEGQRRREWLDLVDYLDSPGFDVLTRRLDGFTDLTPWSELAHHAADQVLPPILDRHRRRFEEKAQQLSDLPPGRELDESLHDLRKRAKVVRYLGDAFKPSLAGPAKKTRKSMRQVQTVLGDLCDSLLLTSYLERRLLEGDFERAELRILQHVHADETEKAGYLRSEFLDGYRTGQRRASAS